MAAARESPMAGTTATKVPHPRRVVARRDRNYRNVMRRTRWGNLYVIDEAAGMTRERSLALYQEWLDQRLREDPVFLEPLRGYNLGCTCKPWEPCHADIILQRLYGR